MLLVLGVIGFGATFYANTRLENVEFRSLQREEQQVVEAMVRNVEKTLRTTTADLLYLTSLIERGLTASIPQQSISRTLLDFGRTHASYDQIRFIDSDGLEVVRVDSGSDAPSIIPDGELQDKSARDYFARAMRLAFGKVVVGRMEFNRERGELEYPLEPVIRVATPVADSEGKKAGVAVINFRTRLLLEELNAIGEVASGEPNIIGLDGRWLMEPGNGSDTPFTINALEELGFAERMPREWLLLQQSAAGSFLTERGLFTYTALLPASMEINAGSGVLSSWTTPRDEEGVRGGWVIVSHIEAGKLTELLQEGRMLTGPGVWGLSLLLLLVGWFLSLQIAEARARAAMLRHDASVDVLTGLSNRRAFDRSLAQAIYLAERHSRAAAVLYVDLNRFKELNDSKGHAAGDELLIAVAQRLQESTRKSDVAGRLGGDEFGLILWDLKGRSDAKVVAEKISKHLHAPLQMSFGDYPVSVSLGLAVYPDDGTRPDELMAHADREMYADKARNRKALSAAVVSAAA